MTETATEVQNDTPYFPMDRDMRCPFAPPEGTRLLREKNPVSQVEIWDGSTPWLITGLAELKSLLKDSRISVDESREGFPHWNEGMKANVAMRPKSVFNSDGKEHSHFRRMMTKAFTPKRVNALRPFLQETTDKLIADMLAGPKPADLVTSLALPLPSIVKVTMLSNGKQVYVRINDRGPFAHSRILDLSRGAAEKIGLVRAGEHGRVHRGRFRPPDHAADGFPHEEQHDQCQG